MGLRLMIEIFAPKETDPRETRTSLVPDTVKRLVQLGAKVFVESGAGALAQVDDRLLLDVLGLRRRAAPVPDLGRQ